MWKRWVLILGCVLAACSGGGDSSSTTSQNPVSSTAATVPPSTAPSTTSSSTTVPPSTAPPLRGLAYEVVADGLAFPMILIPFTDSTSLVAFRDGRVHSFDGEQIDAEPLFDLEVSTSGERGLLGMEAGGPDLVYVHYSDTQGDTTVSEITISTGEERVLLAVAQPAGNHNGGMLQFGPDGMLYVGLGDGGGSNDRFGHGQNTESLLGGIVRIDPVSGVSSLWSHGLRNPYRFWFDGDVLYIGDVGQNAFEEIDVVVFDPAGFNFGWPITEGLHCFSPRSGCDTEGITLPVVEVEHGDARTCSITGGVVYRGSAAPELDGHYFYSDYCGGWLRSFVWDGTTLSAERDWTDEVGRVDNVVSFGVDHDGEIYLLTANAIRRIVPVR